MSDVDTSPFPELPPPPDDPGEFLSYFEGDIVGATMDGKDGALILKVKVALEHKMRAIPLTDIRGRRFRWAVYARRGSKPLVKDGKAVIYELRENRERRAAEREAAVKKKPVKKKRRVPTT